VEPPDHRNFRGSMLRIIAIMAVMLAVTPAAADSAAAWEALRGGGHVALMRHADAPGGAGDPRGFKLDDCSTQRNLSDRGRADAAAIGGQIKAKGVFFSRVISSPCDTAVIIHDGDRKRLFRRRVTRSRFME
jgi:hypothetical protein